MAPKEWHNRQKANKAHLYNQPLFGHNLLCLHLSQSFYCSHQKESN